MFIVAGLGNPGPEYEKTRHNIGYKVVDQLASMYRVKVRTIEGKALTGMVNRAGATPFLLAKPVTFMNLSGDSLALLLHKYHITSEQLIVVHDDLDLECGNVRLKKGGSTAGHRGLESTAQRLGTLDFIRIRIGIDRPSTRDEVVDYVLSTFHSNEKAMAEEAIVFASHMILDCIDYGFEHAFNKYPRKKNANS